MKFIVNGILLLAAIGVFFVFTKPQYTDDTEKSVRALEQRAADLLQTRNSLSALETKQRELKRNEDAIPPERIDELEVMLPPDVNPVLLIMELDAIARPNMSLKNVKFEPTKKQTPAVGASVQQKETYDTFMFSFDVTGRYEDFIAFLQAVESGLRIVDITSITVNGSDTGQVYQFNVKAQTYSMK